MGAGRPGAVAGCASSGKARMRHREGSSSGVCEGWGGRDQVQEGQWQVGCTRCGEAGIGNGEAGDDGGRGVREAGRLGSGAGKAVAEGCVRGGEAGIGAGKLGVVVAGCVRSREARIR